MVIKMSKVSWKRENNYVLKDVDWDINKGENWAIIGLNGSGKTTLLNIVNGYIYPSTGEVSVLGKKFGKANLRELRKSIGWVSSSLQESLYMNETVLEIVLSGKFATIGLVDTPEQTDIDKAWDLIDKLGCALLAQRPYRSLSQGEKQKVLIARALINSPELLILDEPCTGLDVIAKEQLLATIEKISKEKDAPTLIYVTHHVDELLPIFKHTLLLNKGTVHSAGQTSKILTSSNLTDFLQTPVELKWNGKRANLRLVKCTEMEIAL